MQKLSILLSKKLQSSYLFSTRFFSISQDNWQNVKNQKLSQSSRNWLQRHLNDPYVKKSQYKNFRARSAHKLIEINEKYKFLRPGQVVIDVGAAPGAWTQIVVDYVKPDIVRNGKVIATDQLALFPIKGAVMLPLLDFTNKYTQDKILSELGNRKVDVCLSDMAPNISGTSEIDRIKVYDLVHSFISFSIQISNNGGHLLCKVLNYGDAPYFAEKLQEYYTTVTFEKPPSSRKESKETFLYAAGFRRRSIIK